MQAQIEKKFENLIQLTNHFSSEEVCRAHLANLRWVDGKARCPYCNNDKVYNIEGGKRYKCANKECHKKFSVTVGTIFENTKLPLRVWFIAIYLACNHSKGISSVQLAKDLGITQKTAWFVLSRIREMLADKAPQMLKGDVEVDETYIGGKEKNKHVSKRTDKAQGGGGKQAVIGLVQRGGKVVAKSIADNKSATIQPIMRHHVAIGTNLHTDEWRAYWGLKKDYNHASVSHSAGQYVDGNSHTNTIEGFWSLFKRGLIGIYHYVSPKHLDRYCDEFAYRYNTRDLTQQERLNTAIFKADGARLTYTQLIRKR